MGYIEWNSRETWLKARRKTLGASEVASAIGMGFNSPIVVWEEKVGKREPKDLSTNERVQYGIQAEEHIRVLFELQHKNDYSVEYHAFRVYHHEQHSFLTATLDGELTRLEDNAHGIWECKTAWIMSKADLERWDNNLIPQHYFIQVCEQLNVTGFDFVVLTAQLIFPDGKSEIRHYTIERKEVESEIEYITQKAVEFWKYVETDKRPPQTLTL